ncbi:hypothetical protein PybrP1_003411 [[Pythium] brassicae (nom. inval.)]|nr:hypothetical protein PybrP1_003411 [[Pythium] brassicae (nom. inval.)]
MQRVASVKRVLLAERPQDGPTRGPESVERVWSDEVDGAWAEGKAPVALLTALLRHVQDEDVANAELVAREILELEPQNELVKDLLAAMKQREAMEETLESESESEEDDADDDEAEEEEEDESESDGDEDDAHDASPLPTANEAKANEAK